MKIIYIKVKMLWYWLALLVLAVYLLQTTSRRRPQPCEEVEQRLEAVPERPLTAREHFGLAQLYHHGKFGREKNLSMALTHYEYATESDELAGRCHLQMAQVFEEQRDALGMIHHYLEALKHGYEESIQHIVNLYAHGLHPYVLPDKIVALRIVSTFRRRPWCQAQMRQLSRDLQYRDLDALRQANVRYQTLPQDIVDTLVDITARFPTRFRMTFNPEPAAQAHGTMKPEPARHDVLLKLPTQKVRNDSQNVHDHSLQNIGNQILDKIQTNDDFDINRACVFSVNDDKKYPEVQRVVNSLVADIKHSRFDRTERDVFNAVWNRVRDNPDMREMFLDNINSCVENEHVVCSTGKIMRMLSTLDVVDKDTPDLKPVWVVRQEIMATIANLINKLSPSDKREYESEDNGRIREKLHAHIRSVCADTYADVLQPDVLEGYMKEYLEHV